MDGKKNNIDTVQKSFVYPEKKTEEQENESRSTKMMRSDTLQKRELLLKWILVLQARAKMAEDKVNGQKLPSSAR